MQIEIKIVGETTDQSFASVLEAITLAMGGLKETSKPAVAITNKTVAAAKTEVVKETTEEVVMTYDEPAPQVEPPKEVAKPALAAKSSKFTLEAVRAEAVAISKSGKREEVKALIAKHGGEKVTDLDAEVYEAFMADLANLKNGK